ncbi:MAG TPA: hypothetical protein VGK54_09520 [Chloroflexota bacterium]|jgi:hypothetical protein
MSEPLDLDALAKEDRGMQPDERSNLTASQSRALIAELRAAHKVVEATRVWAEECAPGGWGEKEPAKFALYDAIQAFDAAFKEGSSE